MTTQDDIRDIWNAVEMIREHTREIQMCAARLEAQVVVHIADTSQHERSPCSGLRSLSRLFWAFVFLTIGALTGLVSRLMGIFKANGGPLR